MSVAAVVTNPEHLRERISHALVVAMKAKDEVRLATLRLVQCAVRDRDIAARAEDRTNGCEEAEILSILSKMVKQREESSKTYDDAGRPELAEREREEIAVIRDFMPAQLSADELDQAASAVVDELDATGLKDMGRCMDALKKRYTGRLDMSKAGGAVKKLLS